MTSGRENTVTAPRPAGWQRWVSLILLFLVLEIAVLSVEQAHWITPQPALTLVLVLALVTAWPLARSRWPGLATHLIALAVGGGITAWQAQQTPSATVQPFAAFLALMTWLMGYLSLWFLWRRQNAWVTVILGGIVVVVNLSNLPDGYYYFFGLYFVAAAVLVTWSRLVKQRCLAGGAATPTRRGLLQLGVSLLAVVVAAVWLAQVAPAVRTPQFQTLLAGGLPWKQEIEDSPLNIFGPVAAKKPLNTGPTRRDVLFSDLWFDKDRVDFVVEAPQPHYWRIETYDTYTAQGWENRPTDDRRLGADEPWDETDGETITYTVTAGINTDVVLTAGEFVAADTPVVVRVSDGEAISVTTPRTLGSGESYTVTSSVASPSPAALAAVTGDYPEGIPNQYTRLPANFPTEVEQLARDITQDATTPYEKVIAIDEYLSQFPYDEDIEPPPPDTDGVAYFLFDQKAGFCIYYASAMVVMLRSVDVPARLAVGYLPGESSASHREFVLHNNYYHAWPQAYFPGYGWVDLEATPGGAGSRVPLDTPWVSAGTLEEYTPPDTALLLPPGLFGPAYGYGMVPGVLPASPTTPSAPTPTADEPGGGLYIAIIIISIIGLLMVVLLVVRRAFRRWLWRVDRENPAAGVYARLGRLAAMAGLEPKPQQTPLEFAASLAAEFPEQARDLDDIIRAYVEARFGRKDRPPNPHQAVQVLKARQSVYTSLLKRLGVIRRILGSSR